MEIIKCDDDIQITHFNQFEKTNISLISDPELVQYLKVNILNNNNCCFKV